MISRNISRAIMATFLLASPVFSGHAQPSDPSEHVDAGPFLVFFDWDRRTVSRDGRAILEEVLAAYRQGNGYRIQLIGHSDRSGPDNVNRTISYRRATVVKDFLVNAGVPAEHIAIEAAGEERLLIHTEDGVREAQNRRVEIHFRPL